MVLYIRSVSTLNTILVVKKILADAANAGMIVLIALGKIAAVSIICMAQQPNKVVTAVSTDSEVV